MIAYPYIVIIVSLLAVALIYLDARIFDKTPSKSTYLKAVAMANVVVGAVLFIINWLSKESIQIGGGGDGYEPIEGPSIYIPEIGEEILSGVPTF